MGGEFVFGSAVGVGLGVALASLAVFVGDSLGSVVAFCLLARYFLRDCVRVRLVKKYTVFEAINEAVQKNGFKYSFFCVYLLLCLVALSTTSLELLVLV